MTRKLRPFTGQPMLPGAWREALGVERHNLSGYVLALAPRKSDLDDLLAASGAGRWLTAELKLRTGELSTPDWMLVEAGVLDLNTACIIVYARGVKDDPVLRIDADGTYRIVAHFRYGRVDRRRPPGLWVEPVDGTTDE
jgi:hypothetical protein